MAKSSSSTFKVGRSASSGKFTSVKTAQSPSNKSTHIVETIKKK